MPEEKDDKGFKVIDRRGVEEPSRAPDTDGVPQAGATEGRGPEKTGGTPPKHPREESSFSGAKDGNFSSGAGVEHEEDHVGKGPASLGVPRFLDLVQSLQMGAMAGLGMLQGPDGKRTPVDLPAAKDAIDLLGILQEKTRGNLTKEEEEILREGLYHLRMGYMAMINPPPTGRGQGGDQR